MKYHLFFALIPTLLFVTSCEENAPRPVVPDVVLKGTLTHAVTGAPMVGWQVGLIKEFEGGGTIHHIGPVSLSQTVGQAVVAADGTFEFETNYFTELMVEEGTPELAEDGEARQEFYRFSRIGVFSPEQTPPIDDLNLAWVGDKRYVSIVPSHTPGVLFRLDPTERTGIQERDIRIFPGRKVVVFSFHASTDPWNDEFVTARMALRDLDYDRPYQSGRRQQNNIGYGNISGDFPIGRPVVYTFILEKTPEGATEPTETRMFTDTITATTEEPLFLDF